MEGNCGDYRPQGSFSPLTLNYYYGLLAFTLLRIQPFPALYSAWPCKSGQGIPRLKSLQWTVTQNPCSRSPALPLCHACLRTAPTSHRGSSLSSLSLLASFPPPGLHYPGLPISKWHPVPLPNLILALLSVTTFIICDTFYLFWYILFW